MFVFCKLGLKDKHWTLENMRKDANMYFTLLDTVVFIFQFFSFAAFVAFGVDVYFKFMKWRAGYPRASTGGGVATTTTTTTTSESVEAGAQY